MDVCLGWCVGGLVEPVWRECGGLPCLNMFKV